MDNKNNTITCVNRPVVWKRWTGSHKCPNCGSDEIEYNTQLSLASYPPKAQLRCKSCGHYFSSGVKSECTDNDALNKLWEHAQSILNIPKVGDWPVAPMPSDPQPNYLGNMNYGWVCPKCGRVNAPHRDFCDCSGNRNPNIVYCNETGNNPNPAPSITISHNDTVDSLNYTFEAGNLHENKENNNEQHK